MEKIDFINNSQPALNATNLNKMQQNIEEAVEELELEQNNKVKTTKTISDTDTYSCNYVNLIGKTITMNSGEGSTQNIPTNTKTKIINTTNEYFNQFDNGEITYNNGEYTINSDNIHTVLVNTQLFFQSSASTQCYIQKNNVTEMQSGLNNIRHAANFILNVQKNDKISIATYVEANNSLRADQHNFSQITVLG